MKSECRILVTGAAGFIGAKVCEFLLTHPEIIPNDLLTNDSMTLSVVGIDNLNDYYDVRLKNWRLAQLKKLSASPRHHPRSSVFLFHKMDIENYQSLRRLFFHYSHSQKKSSPLTGEGKGEGVNRIPFTAVINLAARAGVRYSLVNPFIYYTTNVLGNLNLLELCREFGVNKYVFSSSSSLYAGQKMPFKETLPVNEPISPYAASKKSAEVTCYTYHKLFNIDVSILRYFTVYGPASRPDMSPLRFISWMHQGKPITIYGDGNQSRDFTYIDDIAQGTIQSLKPLGFEIINLGSDEPHTINEFLQLIWQTLVEQDRRDRPHRPIILRKPSHPADMQATWANIKKARRMLGWKPKTDLREGIKKSIEWFLENRVWAAKIKL